MNAYTVSRLALEAGVSVHIVRDYLLRGGFLIVDDFHGTWEWDVFMASFKRVFPDRPVVDIDNGIDSTTSGPAVSFQVHMARAAHAGFSPQDVANEANAMLDGVTAPDPIVVNDRPYTLRIRYPSSVRSSLNDMNNLMLISPSGQTANLGSLASMTDMPGQTEILQDNQQRYVAVTARLEGLDMGHGIAAVQDVLAKLHMPPSIRIEYGGLRILDIDALRSRVFARG